MTEAEWLVCTDPKSMLKFLWDKASDRKLRLFACAYSRQFWPQFDDERSRAAVEIAERYADARAEEQQREKAWKEAYDVVIDAVAKSDFERAAIVVRLDYQFHSWTPADVYLIRDVFGNPFCPVTISPTWLTPNVVALAKTIYDDRAFNRLPELSDGLVKAGCDNGDILNHCRSEGPHVRGCWVVDLILGKE